MTAGLPPGALMGFDTPDCPGRHELGIVRWLVLRRFESEPAAPESWAAPLCSCGRCDGGGRCRITTAGVEEWVPCRGGTGYLPAAAAGDWWKS